LATADRAALPVASCEFVPVGVFAEVDGRMPAAARGDDRRPGGPAEPSDRSSLSEIDLVSGTRLRVDASVDERALCRVLRALRQAG
jgi:transposase